MTDDEQTLPDPVDDPEQTVARRLSRPHPSGGVVIERAAIMAAGTGAAGILDWITTHGGQPELAVAGPGGGGLHGERDRVPGGDTPLRYVLPAGALQE